MVRFVTAEKIMRDERDEGRVRELGGGVGHVRTFELREVTVAVFKLGEE